MIDFKQHLTESLNYKVNYEHTKIGSADCYMFYIDDVQYAVRIDSGYGNHVEFGRMKFEDDPSNLDFSLQNLNKNQSKIIGSLIFILQQHFNKYNRPASLTFNSGGSQRRGRLYELIVSKIAPAFGYDMQKIDRGSYFSYKLVKSV